MNAPVGAGPTSLAQRIAALPPTVRARVLASMAPEDGEALLHSWRFWARRSQMEPPGDWDTWLILAGRGFGKTRAGSGWVHEKVEQGYLYIALVARSEDDGRKTMIEKQSGIVKTAHPDFRPVWEPSNNQLIWPPIRGARPTATLFTAEQPEALRGPEHDAAWLDEFGAYGRNADEVWRQVRFGLRYAKRPKALITTTGRPLPRLRMIAKRARTCVTRGHTCENRGNVADDWLAEQLADFEGTDLGRQELGGDILDDAGGTLFSASAIEAGRAYPPLGFVAVVIAIDPAISNRGGSDLTGIVVIALGRDGRAYVLEDHTGKYEAHRWAEVALLAAERWGSSSPLIVAETNRGGNMVQHTLRAYRAGGGRGDAADPRALELEDIARRIRIEEVHAGSGEDKVRRATPVATAYHRGRVSHVIGAKLEELEKQMTTWTPGEKSPDRMDALVWGVTKLLRLDEKRPDAGEYKTLTAEGRLPRAPRRSGAEEWDEAPDD